MDLIRAQAALVSAQFSVWARPSGQLVCGDSKPDTQATDCERDVAVRLANAVDRAGDYGIFRPRCLVRAVALVRLLREQGIQGSRIRIGVRWNGRGFLAHAWVEYGSLVLLDKIERTSSFSRLADMQLVGPR
jgi:hypothetical protein